jgi:hypothetical protein
MARAAQETIQIEFMSFFLFPSLWKSTKMAFEVSFKRYKQANMGLEM